jgi:hypothetical protein
VTPIFVVGIDLGTTHTALSYARIGAESPVVEQLLVPQLVDRGQVDSRALLPSFLYAVHESDAPHTLPWQSESKLTIGEFARARASEAPHRVISSAKSWLCHPGVDRRAALLPHNPAGGHDPDLARISPVEASRRLLEHLANAWDHAFAQTDESLRLAHQDVVLTVPASFDPAARERAVEAARAAGLAHVTLLEEPQAALYAWVGATGDAWRKAIKVGDVVVVVDVGGGTTDFSAIVATERDGSLELERVAVGDHILLGGDNMDLALAHTAAGKLREQGKHVDDWQMSALVHLCRVGKERLLQDESLATFPIAVAARGSKLIGGGLRTELTREELTRLLLDGFFPGVEATARPAVRARSALVQLGLPFASDPAITKHLAAFLGRQAGAALGSATPAPANVPTRALLHPTVLLFNGGVMKAPELRARVEQSVAAWVACDGGTTVRTLSHADLDLAVARGAAYYGLSRHGRGIRIRGGTAKSYYVGIESASPAVPGLEPPVAAYCIAPFGLEEGSDARVPEEAFGAVIGEPVRFRFFASATRRADVAGTLLQRWPAGEVEELAPIEITLPVQPLSTRAAGDVVPVRLGAKVTEVGTLALEAVPLQPLVDGERWQVELTLRGGA